MSSVYIQVISNPRNQSMSTVQPLLHPLEHPLEEVDILNKILMEGGLGSTTLMDYERAVNKLFHWIEHRPRYSRTVNEKFAQEKCIAWIQNFSAKNDKGDTFLHVMFANPLIFNRKLLFAFMSQGANVFDKNHTGKTVLDIILESQNKDFVAAILDFYIQGYLGEMGLKSGLDYNCRTEITKIILAFPILNLNHPYYQFDMTNQRLKFLRLTDAAKGNDIKLVQKLLESGVDINCGSHKCLPFIQAITYNSIDVVKILLTADIDLSKTTIKEDHPVIRAHVFHTKKPWYDYGSLSNIYIQRSIKEFDSICVALNLGFTEIAELLIHHQYPIKECDANQLYVAILNENKRAVELLLEHGVNIHKSSSITLEPMDLLRYVLKELRKEIPYETSKRSKHTDAAKLLIKYGANPNSASDFINYCIGRFKDHLDTLATLDTSNLPKIKISDDMLKQDPMRARRIIWRNRQMMNVIFYGKFSSVLEFYEFYHYRVLIDSCLNPNYIKLLEKVVESVYFEQTGNYFPTDKEKIMVIIKDTVNNVVDFLYSFHSKEIGETAENYGIAIDTKIESELKSLLSEILQILLKQNLFLYKVFERIEAWSIYQAFSTSSIRNLIEEYLSWNQGKLDAQAKACFEVPALIFGSFDSELIKLQIEPVHSLQKKAAIKCMGSSLEARDTVAGKPEVTEAEVVGLGVVEELEGESEVESAKNEKEGLKHRKFA